MTDLRTLNVFLDGCLIGQVQQASGGALSFTYGEEYRSDPDATPLSLSMPLKMVSHKNKAITAFLDGLLPDSEPARQRWARQYGVNANNPFSLLRHVGRDAAGAVQILPPDEDASDAAAQTGDIEWLSDTDFAELARGLAEHAPDWDPGRFGGRWSLAGAQPKIALFRDPDTGAWGVPRDSTPTNCIVKPSVHAFGRHHVNEALCQRAAQEAGLAAANVDLVEVAGVQAFVSHRYDREQRDGRWHRIHQEDLCQALSVRPLQKYQNDGGPGVAAVGQLLQRLELEDRARSTERFFKGLAFNALIGGTDAHAKNYSLLLIGNRAQLGPLYDVASAACYSTSSRLNSAMKIGARWAFLDVGDADWRRVARQLDVPGEQALAWVEELRSELPGALQRAAASLPHDVQDEAAHMAERITEHVVGSWRPDEAALGATSSPPLH